MHFRLLILAIALLAIFARAAGAQSQGEEWPEITSAADLQNLAPEEAAQGRRVRIQGIVTHFSGQFMFMQDETGGVCVAGPRDVSGPREPRQVIRAGMTVEVRGVTAAGRAVPYVTNRPRELIVVSVISSGSAPVARPAKLSELLTPALHAQLIEVEGTIRSVRKEALSAFGADGLIITLSAGSDRIEAVLMGWPAATTMPAHFVGGVYRLRGVFNCAAPERQQNLSMRLLVPSLREVRMREPAQPPFELPVTSVAGLDEMLIAPAPRPHRPRIQGAVSMVVPGKGFFVESENAGVWVDAPAPSLRAGDGVDVVGFLGQRGWSVVLEDAMWRSVAAAPLPLPPLLPAEQAFAGEYDARRVRIEALVLSVSRLTEGPTLVLQSGEKVFLARLADPTATAPLARVREDSWVRVSGVCVNNVSPESPVDAASDIRPVSFHLLMGPDAIEVIRAPSWWTIERTLGAIAALVVVTLAAFAWVLALRRRVARQTRLLREHVSREAAYEERVRIARELHDSVGQDLLGISMQLNATEKLLAAPDRARHSLQLASAMVRRSQAETHRAVWDLREGSDRKQGLLGKLNEAVEGLQSGATASISVRATGLARPLSAHVENHVLRVALEALTNALKHAAPRQINIDLTFSDTHLTLVVADDGRGFDASQAPAASSGRFGLFGMRERAEKLGADLTIESWIGEGAKIMLRVPAPSGEAPAAPHPPHSSDPPALRPSLSPR